MISQRASDDERGANGAGRVYQIELSIQRGIHFQVGLLPNTLLPNGGPGWRWRRRKRTKKRRGRRKRKMLIAEQYCFE